MRPVFLSIFIVIVTVFLVYILQTSRHQIDDYFISESEKLWFEAKELSTNERKGDMGAITVSVIDGWTLSRVDEKFHILRSTEGIEIKFLEKSGDNYPNGIIDDSFLMRYGQNQSVKINDQYLIIPDLNLESLSLGDIYEEYNIFNLYFISQPVPSENTIYTTVFRLNDEKYVDIVIVTPPISISIEEKKEIYFILQSIGIN